MPDDLLGFVIGPTPYSGRWIWIAALLAIVICLWYGAVFVFTMPNRRIANLPVVGTVRATLLKRRYTAAVRTLGARYRNGELGAGATAAAISRELRAYLYCATGVRAEYLQVAVIEKNELSAAAAVLTQLADAQFNADSEMDVGALSDSAQELIHTWA